MKGCSCFCWHHKGCSAGDYLILSLPALCQSLLFARVFTTWCTASQHFRTTRTKQHVWPGKKRKRLNAGAGKLELLAVYLIINNVVLFYSDRMSTTLREAGISPLFEGSRSFSCSPCLDGSINNFVNLIFVMVIQTQFVVDFVLDG